MPGAVIRPEMVLYGGIGMRGSDSTEGIVACKVGRGEEEVYVDHVVDDTTKDIGGSNMASPRRAHRDLHLKIWVGRVP